MADGSQQALRTGLNTQQRIAGQYSLPAKGSRCLGLGSGSVHNRERAIDLTALPDVCFRIRSETVSGRPELRSHRWDGVSGSHDKAWVY
jgi:hypothetical protein